MTSSRPSSLGLTVRALLLCVLVCLAVVAGAPAAEARAALPSSIAATGDSITRGFNAGWRPYMDSPARSWVTGTDADVASLYRRISRRNPRMRGHRLNLARSGSGVADLVRQAEGLRDRRVDYVTVLTGANDVCGPSEGEMTSVASFRAGIALGLESVHAAAPRARVSVLSIPDVTRLFALGRRSHTARATWRTLAICPSLFARPTSSAPRDRARRERVAARLAAFNAELGAACAARAWCEGDGGAVFAFPIAARHVSRRDFFHPSEAGQRALADVAWRAAFLPDADALAPAP